MPLSGVLITLDTTNVGALDIYGKDRNLTPRLKALATRGVVFERAHTVAPMTLPAHASMLTGLYPIRHGVRENGMMSLGPDAETLAELANEAGFETVAFISASVLRGHYGLDQGFEIYDEPAHNASSERPEMSERDAGAVTDQALSWLRERDPSRPFLLWVHYFDPHVPYSPPEEFIERAGGNLYRGEVAAMDHHLGRLLDGLEETVGFDKLTLAVVADHGESFQAHGEFTHSVYCYEATIRVPFLLCFSDGRRAGTRSEEFVSVVDLFPTFLEELGLGMASGIDGLSLASSTVPDDRGVYMESYSGYITYGWSPLVGWVDKRGKYLHSSAPEFYNLDEDPGEVHNLLADGKVEVGPYTRAIAELSRLPRLKSGEDVQLSAQEIRELNALGYAGAGAPSQDLPNPLDPSDRPSPGEESELYAKSCWARGLVLEGRHEEGIALLREVVAENPGDINALEFLGSALISIDRFVEAIKPLEAVLLQGSERHMVRVCLGVAYEMTGQYEQSLLHYRRAKALRPAGKGVPEAIERLEALVVGK